MALINKKNKTRLINTAKALRLNYLFSKINFHYTIRVNSCRMTIPTVQLTGLQLYNLNSKYVWMSNVVKKLLCLREGIFLDIGANLGQTLLIVKSFDQNMEYFGFEPNSQCVFYIKELINANNFKRCAIIPIGLSIQSDVKAFYKKGRTDGAATVLQGFRKGDEWIYPSDYVPVFRGDDVIKSLDLNNIAFIKVDVEGGELNVLQGLKNTIMKSRPFIICEILPAYSKKLKERKDRKNRQDALMEMIKQNAYQVFRILADSNGKIEYKQLEFIEVHSNLALCDYLFVPNEEIKNF